MRQKYKHTKTSAGYEGYAIYTLSPPFSVHISQHIAVYLCKNNIKNLFIFPIESDIIL